MFYTTSKMKHPCYYCCAGVETTDQVEAMFDSVTYDKGASVLRMLRSYLTRDLMPQPLLRRSLLQVSLSAKRVQGSFAGCNPQTPLGLVRLHSIAICHPPRCAQRDAQQLDMQSLHMQCSLCIPSDFSIPQDGENILYGTGDDPFMKGVRTYLKAHQYNTSMSTDLWEALSTAVGRNVGAWMHGWTFQKGYPLVHVTLGGITNRDVFVLQVPSEPDGAWHNLMMHAVKGTELKLCSLYAHFNGAALMSPAAGLHGACGNPRVSASWYLQAGHWLRVDLTALSENAHQAGQSFEPAINKHKAF